MVKVSSQPSPTFDTDPLRYHVELPYQATLYPMGYAVEISSNSADAIGAAEKLWCRYPALSHASPVRIRVISNPGQTDSRREALPPRGQGHLMSIVHGPHDFAVADLCTGFAFASVSQDCISDHSNFRYYFLEPLVYVMQAARHFVFVHASCVSRDGNAVVLCGDSGSGKTCLAYACAKRGWDFVSGDAVHVVRESTDRMVIGRPYEIRFRESARELFPELSFARPELRSNGKVDLEIDTAELEIARVLHSSARRIVFLERSHVTRLTRCSTEVALRKLEETICFGDDRTRLKQRQSLAYFAGLPIWRLEYSDLQAAEVRLRSLLDGGMPC